MTRLHFLLGTLCAALLFTATPARAADLVTHDLEADYSPGENPDGVWSYGWKSTVNGTFNIYGHHAVQPLPGGVVFDFWVKSANAGAPPSQYHNGAVTFVNGDGTVIPPNVVWFGAGYEGNFETFGAIRFTVPTLGRYRLESAVRSLLESSEAGDYDFHVVRNGVELFGIFMPAQTATGYTNNDITLGSGDVIDFLAGRGTSNTEYGSAIRIKATLTLMDLPPGNLPPTANGQTLETPQDTPLEITLTGADQNGDSLTFAVTTLPTHGTLSGTPPNVTYTPATGYVGPDSFAFKANDGLADSAAAAVNITVSSTNGALPAPGYVKVAWIKNLDEFLVRWFSVPGATSYNVYYFEPTPATWSRVGSDLAFDSWNVPSFRMYFPGAGPGTFAVTAVNAEGESAMVSASVAPAPGIIGSLTLGDEWWPKGYTFVDPGFQYDRLDEGIDGMVELGLSATNFTHAAWHTNFDLGHRLHITNLSPGTVWVTRITIVNSNGIGFTGLYPYYGTYTLPLTPIDVWEDMENSIFVGDYTWAAPAQVFSQALHGTVIAGSYPWDWRYIPEPNFAGTDTFQILDNPDGPPVTLTLNVQNVNDPPVPEPFTVYVAEDTPTVITPTATDLENDPFTFWYYDPPANGYLLWQGSNFVYYPNTDFVGTDQFTFLAMDESWMGTAVGTIIVTNVNDAPIATNQFFTMLEDTSITFDIGGADIDGDALTLEIVNPPVHGSLATNGLTVTYTPNPNHWGWDYFTYRVSDGQATSEVANVDFSIDPVNDAPVAQPGSVTTAEDTLVVWEFSWSDVDNQSVGFEIVDPPQHGTAFGNLYQPAANYFGTDTFTYRVFDGQLYSAPATMTVTVTPVNDLPRPDTKTVFVDEDQSVTNILSGTDADGDTLTFRVLTPPEHGTFTNGVYTPASNFAGSDSLTYDAFDGTTYGDSAVITIIVNPVNDPPVAQDKSVVTDEDVAVNVVLAGFDADDDPLTFEVVDPPQHGAFVDGVYTPAANFYGTDSFTYRANDGQVTSAPATVSITVNSVNDAPSADSKAATVNEDGSVAIVLTGSDIEGDGLTFAVVNAPQHGQFVAGTYTPAANYNGPDSFTYRANDGQLNSTVATVAITVNPVNDGPVADSKSVTSAEDQSVAVALTGSDVDGDTLSFSVVTAPAHGTFANGVYTPAANYFGSDSFTYKANDGQVDSAVATVSITVTAVNDAPVANGQSVSTAYNTAVNIVLTGSDVEGSALTFTTLSSPANGTLSGTGANRTFTPNIGWSGTTSFTFKVNDGALDSATATVTITVAAPTGIPAAPSALTATAVSQNQINLSWTDNSNNEDGFKIERSPNGNSGWTEIATVGPNVTTYSNTGLTKNTRYHYRVRAYNVLGNSAYSNTANARTQN